MAAYLQTLDRGLSHIGSQTGWLERHILVEPGGQPLLSDAARDALARCEALTGKIRRGLLERLTKPVAQVSPSPSEHSFAISDGGED